MGLRSEIRVQTSVEGFRNDINALRAMAFVSVLLYHFRIIGFDGGFAGVDIFLVISGYLMMSIVSRQFEARRFRLIEFYSRRIARLAAPILVVVMATFVAGLFLLPPSAFATLGKHTIGVLTFSSNFMFWRESGYFDVDNTTKFLLHTWSLSLEVQFYLVFPLIILAIRFLFGNRRNLILPLLVLVLTVFTASIVATQLKPVPAFYLLPTRLWEFLLGALVFEICRVTSNSTPRQGLHFIGLALIAVSVTLLDGTMAWPGWRAAIPTAGTALVIFSNVPSHRLYATMPVRFLGAISYSGYLWHWPIVVALVISGGINDPLLQAAGIALTLLFSAYTWFGAERRLGGWLQSLSDDRRVAALAGFIGAAALLPAVAVLTHGLPNRFAPEVNRFLDTAEARPEHKRCGGYSESHCVVVNPLPEKARAIRALGAIVVGDSHAAMVSQIVADALHDARSQVVSLTVPACPTIRGIRVNLDFSGACAKSIDRLVALHKSNPSVPVVVANRYAFYLAGPNETKRGPRPNYSISRTFGSWSDAYVDTISQRYFDTLCEIAKTGGLILVYPFPEFDRGVPTRIALETAVRGTYVDAQLTRNAYEARNIDTLPLLDDIVKKCGAHPVDPFPALCPDGLCTGTRAGAFLYTDSNHLTASGAALVAGTLSQAVVAAVDHEAHE